MCGLAGIVDMRGIEVGALPAMADALAHRGPDGEGYALASVDGPVVEVPRDRLAARAGERVSVGLAHRRLTIIDLSDASDQPMIDPAARMALVYNGELYNYVELRRELESLGRRFRSSGDTEVVLAAWKQWGRACLERFVGMWAFALVDLDRREIVLCRDRFGIKPLFWARVGGTLWFASEIKALLAVMPRPEPDDATVGAFLLAAADSGRQTFFSGIERLEPAHTLTLPLQEGATPRLERYWKLPDGPVADGDQAAARFAEMFADAILLHTRSDVAVGTCLSGGLDSSSIVCSAAALRRAGALPPTYRHHAFGYVPADESVSERRWMDLVVAHTGTQFTEVRPSRERFETTLETVVRQQDEPFSSTSMLAQWFVFEAARKAGMKVMLDGQGADEVLGGYHGYLVTIAAGMVNERRRLAYARLALDYRRRLGSWPLPWSSTATLVPTRARAVLARAMRGREASTHRPTPAVTEAMTAELHSAARPTAPMPTDLNGILRQQTEEGALRSLLRYEDRNSMAHSIEARVPFLDHRLVEFAFSLPPEAKVRGAETKRLLREAMSGVLPERVRRRRDKLGFAADPGVAAAFAARYRDELIANATEVEARWFDERGVRAHIDAAQSDRSLEFALWRILNVKLWARAHWERTR